MGTLHIVVIYISANLVISCLSVQTRIQSVTKLKKIIQDLKDTMAESDVRCQMQPLKDLLVKTIDNLYSVFEPHVFIAICRGFWDRMGQVNLVP